MGELFHRYVSFTPMRLRDLERFASEMEVQIGYAINRRRKYLLDELDFWLGVDTDMETWEVLCRPMFFKIADELVQLVRDVYWRRKPKGPEEVTDEMKLRAKAYPVTELVDFTQGKALAFCHADKAHSLLLWAKGNRASCHVCNKRFDPIDILMIRDGLKYHDAVRRLCAL